MGSEMCIRDRGKTERQFEKKLLSFMQVILGQRYGGHPPPTSIDAAEFAMLLSILEETGESTAILREWYQCDENNIPPVHILRPIVEEGREVTFTTNYVVNTVFLRINAAADSGRRTRGNVYYQLCCKYRISSNKRRGVDSKQTNFSCGVYSRTTTIRGRCLFEEIRYVQT